MQNPEFKCICNGKHKKDDVCHYWSKYSLKCTMNGYPDNDRCKFWAQIYMLRTAAEE